MPVGGAPLGIAYFAAVKLAGYSAAGLGLRRAYRTERPKPLVFGIARTALGFAAGAAFGAIAGGLHLGRSDLFFYALLAPIRLAEWVFIVWLFFDRKPSSISRLVGLAVIGSIWSYVLDAPAIFAAFVLPGGMWIC